LRCCLLSLSLESPLWSWFGEGVLALDHLGPPVDADFQHLAAACESHGA
jgi:hypothetical protein